MTPVSQSMKDKLRDAQVKEGHVRFGSGSNLVEPTPSAQAFPVDGEVSAQVPKIANADPLHQAATDSAGKLIGADAAGSAGDAVAGNTLKSPEDLFTTEEVKLDEIDRETFLDALINGTRYERKFFLYGGKITGRMRCRSTEESEAIAAYMNHG